MGGEIYNASEEKLDERYIFRKEKHRTQNYQAVFKMSLARVKMVY